MGFNLVISGIRANASMVGDGEDIMANVMIGDTVVNSAPLKVADVTEGLVVKADVAAGLQCADTDDCNGRHHDPGRFCGRDRVGGGRGRR